MTEHRDRASYEAGREALALLRLDIEQRVAEVSRLFGVWHIDCAAFGSHLHDIVTDAKERTYRSRHPRLHSKGRRSRWPRGVRG